MDGGAATLSGVPAKRNTFRPDIQGLRPRGSGRGPRPLIGWPTGGFIGVDVFFVISGFLITGLLLREHERTGRISFVGFYGSRVRRILPAAALVLAATVAAAYFLFGQARSIATVMDAIWAFFFAANSIRRRRHRLLPGRRAGLTAAALLVAGGGGAVLRRLAVAGAADLGALSRGTSAASGNAARSRSRR